MKKIIHLALLWMFYLLTSAISAQNNRPATNNVQDMEIFYHVVERGQTVYSIAKMYDVMVLDIYKLNLGSEDGIKAGDRLKIPQRKFEEKSVLKANNPGATDDNYIIHTIQPKETLYGIAKKYDVSVENLLEANPLLTPSNFMAGKKIRIPKPVVPQKKAETEIVETKGEKEVYYTVPAGETVYNICKKFKTTESELIKLNPELSGGLRAGITIRIPLRINENELKKPTQPDTPEMQAAQNAATQAKLAKAVKVALLLPFDTENAKPTNIQKQMTEYYEGFLLAADSIRKQGFVAEVFIYDIGKEEGDAKTKKLLQEKSEELKKAELIIGGFDSKQINHIADFAKQHAIKYIIPFSRKDEKVHDNAFLFQASTPPDYQNTMATYAGANLFGKHHIIFLDTKDEDEQTEFIKAFKKELKERNMSYKEAVYDAEHFEAKILPLLSTDKPNMIMPVSRSLNAFRKIKSVLRMIAETKPEYNIALFGYPLWQTFFEDCKECPDDFHALDTYIFSYFYADITHPNMKSFYDNYRKWYSKSPSPAPPKYSMIGYDTGMFFLGAIQKYGVNFEDNLSDINYKSLQTGFNFERVNDSGGFINKNIYIIHFAKDYKIIRSDFK